MFLTATCIVLSCAGDEKKNTNENATTTVVNEQSPASYKAPDTLPATSGGASALNDTARQKSTQPAQTNTSSTAYIKPQMVFVQGGTFRMGDNKRKEPEEKPEHTVTVNSFWIGKYEVTVAEFRRFMNTHTYVTDGEKDGYSWTWDGKSRIIRKDGVTWDCDVYGEKHVNEENHPISHVSRNDAQAYCKWLSQQTGKEYRLATEAEWEYAAKGGPHHNKFEYSGGNDMELLGWYAFNSDFVTHPVGMLKPNSLGIYDMSGNLWEWVSDWFATYPSTPQTNPKGPAMGTVGVVRGGGWRYFALRARCAARRDAIPAFNGSGIGFRLASSGLSK